MTLRRPSPATCLASIALFVALGGPAQAAKTLGLKNSSVTSAKIKNRTIATRDLSPSAVRSLRVTPPNSLSGANVVDGSLGGADLAAGSIDGDRLVPGTVGAALLAPGSIGGDRLAPASIGGDRLAAGSIGGDRLAPNSVDAGRIVDGSVGTPELADGGVGSADLAPNAVGPEHLADGRLQAADIGRFAGTLTGLNFGTVNPGTCTAVASTSLTPIAGNQDLRDDVIMVTPQAGFPADRVSFHAIALSANQIQVTVCTIEGPAVLVGARSFSYMTVDRDG